MPTSKPMMLPCGSDVSAARAQRAAVSRRVGDEVEVDDQPDAGRARPGFAAAPGRGSTANTHSGILGLRAPRASGRPSRRRSAARAARCPARAGSTARARTPACRRRTGAAPSTRSRGRSTTGNAHGARVRADRRPPRSPARRACAPPPAGLVASARRLVVSRTRAHGRRRRCSGSASAIPAPTQCDRHDRRGEERQPRRRWRSTALGEHRTSNQGSFPSRRNGSAWWPCGLIARA